MTTTREERSPASDGTANHFPFRDSGLSPEKRVADLLARMTLDDKAAQMRCLWRKQTLVDDAGNFDLNKARAAFASGGIGQVARPSDRGKGKGPREMAELTNAIQKFVLENTRLGIPILFHEECLHGHAA